MCRLQQLKMHLQELSLLFGPSGREAAVRDYLIQHIRPYADFRVDALGNLIVEKKGKARPAVKVMLDAHMDEVGVIVTAIRPDGLLQFETVGGITPEALFGKQVDFGNLFGVIGGLPVHLLQGENKNQLPQVKDMLIHIGCDTEAQARALLSEGSMGVFSGDFVSFGEGFLKGKALDDRAGCAILLDMIQSELPYDMTFTFTVGEEIGLVGAKTAAYQVQPEVALVLETTTAADVAGSTCSNRVCALGEGTVLSFMDRATVYHRELYELAFEIARKNALAVQSKNAVAGGNNSGSIHSSGKGIPTLALSLPCRYLHSASCVIHESDLLSTAQMARQMAMELAAGNNLTEKIKKFNKNT